VAVSGERPRNLSEVKDGANVGVPGLGRELAHPHLLEHALAQR
jgi:hypothetical protein